MGNILPNTKVTWSVRKCKRHLIKLKRWFPWAISIFWIISGMLNQVSRLTNALLRFCLFFSIGGGFRPVRELADRMNVIIQEYYDSGDVDETNRCLKELNVPHFFHEFVYELIDFCLEKNKERFVDRSRRFSSIRFVSFRSSRAQQLTIDLLEKLTKSAVITYDQLKTGMFRIFDDIEDIHLDVPNVYEQLQVLLKQLEEKKILNQDITSNAPVKGRKRVTSEGDNHKQEKSTNWSQCKVFFCLLMDRSIDRSSCSFVLAANFSHRPTPKSSFYKDEQLKLPHWPSLICLLSHMASHFQRRTFFFLSFSWYRNIEE